MDKSVLGKEVGFSALRYRYRSLVETFREGLWFDLFWLALVGLLALLPAVPAVTANSFLMHVLILILLYAGMARELASGAWDGDRDSLMQQPAAEVWSPVAAESSSCTGKHCPAFNSCTYYEQRKALVGAQVIVALALKHISEPPRPY